MAASLEHPEQLLALEEQPQQQRQPKSSTKASALTKPNTVAASMETGQTKRTTVSSPQRGTRQSQPPEPNPPPPQRQIRSTRGDLSQQEARAQEGEQVRHCPLCPYTPSARIGSQLCIHINTRHSAEARREIGQEALAQAQVRICEVCSEAMPDSNAGRNAHQFKCGAFRSRNDQIKEERVAYTTQQNASGPPMHNHPNPPRDRNRQAPKQQPLTRGEFLAERPPTKRMLQRHGWEDMVEATMSQALRGYRNDDCNNNNLKLK